MALQRTTVAKPDNPIEREFHRRLDRWVEQRPFSFRCPEHRRPNPWCLCLMRAGFASKHWEIERLKRDFWDWEATQRKSESRRAATNSIGSEV